MACARGLVRVRATHERRPCERWCGCAGAVALARDSVFFGRSVMLRRARPRRAVRYAFGGRSSGVAATLGTRAAGARGQALPADASSSAHADPRCGGKRLQTKLASVPASAACWPSPSPSSETTLASARACRWRCHDPCSCADRPAALSGTTRRKSSSATVAFHPNAPERCTWFEPASCAAIPPQP